MWHLVKKQVDATGAEVGFERLDFVLGGTTIWDGAVVDVEGDWIGVLADLGGGAQPASELDQHPAHPLRPVYELRRRQVEGLAMVDVWDDFQECEDCDLKPGSPVLCPRCVHNRDLVRKLQDNLRHVQRQAKISAMMLEDLVERVREGDLP